MPRLLALEWDSREARVAVAQSYGDRVVVEQAFSVELGSRGSGSPDVGPRLAAALAARDIGRVQTLVAVGRASIELRLLSLPPAPQAELPDLVRFQAQKEFDSLEADWPLDFLPLAGSEEKPHDVLAAMISPDVVQQIAATCKSSGLSPRRLVLRPCAAAALLRRSASLGPERVRLLVDLLTDDVDLTVLVDHDVVYMRTVRLPGEPGSGAQQQALRYEIRRTMAAVQNQLSGDVVEAVYVCGSQTDRAELTDFIEEGLAQSAHVFDPFADVELGAELRGERPEHPGRYAPLLGMLLDEAENAPHAIDFLHPRQRPQAESPRRLLALAAAAVVLLAVGIGGSVWRGVADLDRQIALERTTLAGLDESLPQWQEAENIVAQIDSWQVADVTWLDALVWLSERFPDSETATVTNMTFGQTALRPTVGMDVLVKEAGLVDDLEDGLRGERLAIDSSIGEDPDDAHYKWKIRSTVSVVGESTSGEASATGSALPGGGARP